MPKLDTNLSAFAQVSGGRTMRGDSPSATEARQLLRDFRAGLVGEDGSVSSGYLSINRKSGGGVAMETRGRHQWGSWHTDKKDAANFIRHLISTGYGSELSTQTKDELNRELSSYLGKTQDRFGTQSFVRLVDKLEKELNPDKVVLPAPATITAKTSVKAQFQVVSRATEDATKRFQALQAKLKTVDQLGKCSPEAKPAFDKIVNQASEQAVSHFSHLLAPPKKAGAAAEVQSVAKPTQVVGDADGSICRMVLAGMNAGYISLPEEQLTELAELMDAEATAALAYNHGEDYVLEEFQKNPDIAAKFDRIVSNATFKPGHSKLVFLGDILHDRFSNNKQAMEKLIRGMHRQDAVFITGNHDVYSEVNGKDDLQESDEELKKMIVGNRSGKDAFEQTLAIKLQNGFYGAKQLTKVESDQLLKDCFKNAHLDHDNLMLYTHNGFQSSGVGDYYLTAFGILKAGNAEELVEKLNQCDFDKPRGVKELDDEIGQDETDTLLDQIQNAPGGAIVDADGTISKTDFRPKDNEMTSAKLGPAGKTSDGKPVKIVHGHNDNHASMDNVENLNARSNRGVTPITKLFE
jgi:hypothetical protein